MWAEVLRVAPRNHDDEPIITAKLVEEVAEAAGVYDKAIASASTSAATQHRTRCDFNLQKWMSV